MPFQPLRDGLNQNNTRLRSGTFRNSTTQAQLFKDGKEPSMNAYAQGRDKIDKNQGQVLGPGGPKDDQVPAMVSDSEAILTGGAGGGVEKLQALFGNDIIKLLNNPKVTPDQIMQQMGGQDEMEPMHNSMEEAQEVPHYANGRDPLQPSLNGFPDYGYGNRYQPPNDTNPPRPKALGFYGPVPRPGGGFSSEISTDVGHGEIPTMVPGLNPNEMKSLLETDTYKPAPYKQPANLPDSIYQKAGSYAAFRQLNGKAPFAGVNDKFELMPVDNDPNVSNALRAPNDPPYNVPRYEDGKLPYEDQNLLNRAKQVNSVNYGRPPDSGIPRNNLNLQERAALAPKPTGPIQPRTLAPEPTPQNLLGRAAQAPQPTGQINPITLKSDLQARANAAPKPSGGPQTLGSNLGTYDDAVRAARVGPRQTGLPDLPTLGPRVSEGAFKDALHNAGSEAGIASGLAYDVLAEPGIAQKRDEAIQGLRTRAGLNPNATPFQALNAGVEELGKTGLKGFVDRGLNAVNADNAQQENAFNAGVSQFAVPQPLKNAAQQVGDYVKSYQGMPALPAVGKAMSDSGSAIGAGAQKLGNLVVGANQGYQNFLYGEGNPTLAQQWAAPSGNAQAATNPVQTPSLAAPKVLQPKQEAPQQTAQQAVQQPTQTLGPQQAQELNVYGEPVQQASNYYQVNRIDPETGKNVTTSIIPWNAQTDMNAQAAFLPADQYRSLAANNANMANQKALSEQAYAESVDIDPKTGRVTGRNSTRGGFEPTLSQIDPAVRGLSPDKQAELLQRQLQFEAEQNKNTYGTYTDESGNEVYYPKSGPLADKKYSDVQQATEEKSIIDQYLANPSAPGVNDPKRIAVVKKWLQTKEGLDWLKSQQ